MLTSARARPALGSLIGLLLSANWVVSATEPSRPAPPTADYVFVIMLDGTRPDVLRDANIPVIHRLADEGVQYLQATTIYPSQTRVAFVSLPTGATRVGATVRRVAQGRAAGFRGILRRNH
ncbi:MAG TPA: alkaline phosphatase family protein [Vicinamibacteria bacterium]|nr:alkaline phosphatase family protein [Vicinamibacteria bacterium]